MTPEDDFRRRHLQELLGLYETADELEERHRNRMLLLLSANDDPFARDHWAPGHFTASACVLSPDRRSVLLIFHQKLCRWLQPGGHVEKGDTTIFATALREVSEETGIVEPVRASDAPLDVDVHRIPARGRDPEHEHFDVRFSLVARERAYRAGSDALRARWVALEDIATIETDASVLRAVEKIRRMVD